MPDHESEQPTASVGPDAPTHARPPERIDRYEILSVIGEGGMGVVYRARQEKPAREVALKVIRAGVPTSEQLRRFELEADVLGRLKHPGIAQVYDAGTLDEGAGAQPYFAMELVDGQPLTKHAAARGLSVRDRLALFAKVCDAVQHAHGKGVIHRDLKPGNILVTPDGEPKVLDFGVARLTDADVQSVTMQTDIGQLIGTVPYMSPEQVAGDPGDLDTRSDVYALGVVLYELLTDRLPYDLRQKMIAEAARIIQEEEPTSLSSVSRALRGDIETIVGTALAKEKDRRYASASAFAADLRRFLQDEPIAARPPSASYQLQKFARRNKALVGGVVATFIALAGGLVGTTTFALGEAQQRQAADQARAEAERIAEFQAEQLSAIEPELMGVRLRASILDAAPEASRADLETQLAQVNFTSVALGSLQENLFVRSIGVIDEQFADQPLVQARLLQTVSDTLSDLGLLAMAMGPQERALAIWRAELGDDHPETLISINNMGRLLRNQGKLAEAAPYTREALERSRRTLGDDHMETLAMFSNMALLLQEQGRFAEAEPYFREALEGSRRTLGDDHPDTMRSINNMGSLLYLQGKRAEAEPYFREALEMSRRTLGDDHRTTLTSINNMGVLLDEQGRLAEAEPYYREALEGNRRTLGDDHMETLISITNMGFLLSSQGKLAEAEPYFREALEGKRRTLGDDHPGTLRSISNMGGLLKLQGRLAESEPYIREALEGRRRTLGDDHPDTLISTYALASILVAQKEPDDAIALLEPVEDAARAVFTGGNAHRLGVFLLPLGKARAALDFDSVRYADAEANLLEAHAIFVETRGPTHKDTRDATQALVDLYTTWHEHEHEPDAGHDAKAAEWRECLAEIDAATGEPASTNG